MKKLENLEEVENFERKKRREAKPRIARRREDKTRIATSLSQYRQLIQEKEEQRKSGYFSCEKTGEIIT